MIPEKDNQHGASLSTAAIRIEAAPVQRDENGHWTHPAVPPFDEGQEVQYRAWLDSNGLEITYKMLESESEHPLHDAYFEDGECNISTWTPAAPEGDGWFTLSIHDTEDGPIWVWARHALRSAGDTSPASDGCEHCIGTYCLLGEKCSHCGHKAESQGVKRSAGDAGSGE